MRLRFESFAGLCASPNCRTNVLTAIAFEASTWTVQWATSRTEPTATGSPRVTLVVCDASYVSV